MVELLKALVPLAGPAMLFGVAAFSYLERGQQPVRVKTALALASGGGVVAAFVTIAFLILGGPYTKQLLGSASLDASIRIDGLAVTIFTMVTLLVLVIARFSATYLAGDQRHGVFLGRLAATAASVEVLVLANHMALFWIAWVSTSVCLHRLLLFYPERPRAVLAARKKFIVARLGDVFLACAFVFLFQLYGTGSFEEIFARVDEVAGHALFTGAGVFLALTALLKSAQFPTHGWLVEVMETPTPVSALLHAGILNAGPFLILRFAPMMEHAQPANWLLLAVGGFTAAFASVVLLTQPSVKVALGYSSAAHMGFMLFVCGLGVYPAVALHLVAHSFYKAHAFLSAGSAVEVAQASRVVIPARRWSPLPAALGLMIASATYGGVAWALGFHPLERSSLLLIGAIVVAGLTQLLGTGLDCETRPTVHLQVVVLAGIVTTAFFGLEELAGRILADSLPPLAAPTASVFALAGLIVAAWTLVVAIQVLGWGRATRAAHRLRVHLRHGLYANALFDRLLAPPKHSRTTTSTRAPQP